MDSRQSRSPYLFDNAGNTTRDAESRRFTYDAENKQTKVETLDANDNPIATIGEYFYDGDGKRIKKVVPGGETTIFVYDAGGKLIGEYSTVVQPIQDAKTVYTTNDHLGSPRINTDATGQVISRHDYHPFGEEVARTGYGSDTIRKQFTGYERDGETGLDFAQARMFTSSHGRFTSPDPSLLSVKAHRPQSWNRYTYVLNNPILYVDPLGLWALRWETVYKTDKDGNHVYRDGKLVVDYVKVTAIKTNGDKDTGARLAEQLGLKGKEASAFAEKVGSSDNIRLSEQGGDVGRVFRSVESGMKEQSKFQIEHPDRAAQGAAGPRSSDCSETACRIAYPMQMFGTLTFSVQEADEQITGNNARSIPQADLRVADIVRWAKNGSPTHFASFIFREDDGTPLVYSKSGARGVFEIAGTTDERWNRYNYGAITGIASGGTGYYRP